VSELVDRLRGAAESLRNCEEPFGCILRDRIAKLFDEGADELERQARLVQNAERRVYSDIYRAKLDEAIDRHG
jgi:hypothetical protein